MVFVNVKREGNVTRSGFEVLDETNLFKGKENSLIMTQSYTHDFQCVYQLQRYPFDTQVGFINCSKLCQGPLKSRNDDT